jgi:hypothetical protein
MTHFSCAARRLFVSVDTSNSMVNVYLLMSSHVVRFLSYYLPLSTAKQFSSALFIGLPVSFSLSRSFLCENNHSPFIDKLERVVESTRVRAKESAYVSTFVFGYHAEHKDDILILLMSNNDIHDHRYLIDFNRHSLDR